MSYIAERHPFVSFLNPRDKTYAKSFALKHALVFMEPREIRKSKTHKLVIWANPKELQLQDLSNKTSKPFYLDFLNFQKIFSENTLLRKCFSSKDLGSTVIDLTAGFCIDAFSMAVMGFEVMAMEKISWLYQITEQGLERARADKRLNSFANKISLEHKNSLILAKGIKKAEIAYIDPMFQSNDDSRAKKEIQFLRNLEIQDEAIEVYIDFCLKQNFKKIIVKSGLNSNKEKSLPLKPSNIIRGRALKYLIFQIPG